MPHIEIGAETLFSVLGFPVTNTLMARIRAAIRNGTFADLKACYNPAL